MELPPATDQDKLGCHVMYFFYAQGNPHAMGVKRASDTLVCYDHINNISMSLDTIVAEFQLEDIANVRLSW